MSLTRVLYSNNGVITDLTTALSNYASGVATISGFDSTQDFFYVGQRHPFNRLYLKPGSTPQTAAVALQLAYWDGDEWIDVVEHIDETSSLEIAGHISWVPNRSRGWMREDTTSPAASPTGQEILGLENVVIYDQYWLRIKLASNPIALFDLAFIGQKFADDPDLGAEYPALTRQVFRDAFTETAGTKPDWNEQHVKAAEIISSDMIAKGIIWHQGQILSWDRLRLAGVSKLAELIFSAMGQDYVEERNAARQEYNARLSKGIYEVDRNRDAILDVAEEKSRTGFLSR